MIFRELADERAGDNPPDAVNALNNLARSSTKIIKLFNWNNLFMRGDLQDAVGGGVNN